MGIKALKQGLGLTCIMAFLAGCASTSNETGVSDASTDTAGSTGVVDQPQVQPQDTVQPDETVALETVFYFDFDQSILTPSVRAALTAHAERLKSSPRSIRLEGHADERGTREYNMALGERRANAVRDFLMLHGVRSSLIETVSYGEEYPLAQGSSESSWAKNRRVELK